MEGIEIVYVITKGNLATSQRAVVKLTASGIMEKPQVMFMGQFSHCFTGLFGGSVRKTSVVNVGEH